MTDPNVNQTELATEVMEYLNDNCETDLSIHDMLDALASSQVKLVPDPEGDASIAYLTGLTPE